MNDDLDIYNLNQVESFEIIEQSNQEIIQLLKLKINNDIEIHSVYIVLFSCILSFLAIISFFRVVFNND